MDSNTIVEVVRKLVGPIDPVGDETLDIIRLANLKALTEALDYLLGDVDRVSENRHRHLSSMKRAGEHAYQFMARVSDAHDD